MGVRGSVGEKGNVIARGVASDGAKLKTFWSLFSTGPAERGGVAVMAVGTGNSIGFGSEGDTGWAVTGVSGKVG